MPVVWIVGALISIASVTYIWYVASEEPFFFMSTATLVTLEGLGLILVVLLGIWAWVALAAARTEASKLRLPLSALALSWTLVCGLYLTISMLGCWQDYQRFRYGHPGTLGSVEASPSAR